MVPFAEALRFWLKLGFISFGGPAGQIAILHREVVERRRWLSEERFFHALSYCMLLPGPEAQQLATYVGWILHGVRGGLAAGGLFVLPSAFLLAGLSYVYMAYGHLAAVVGVMAGFKPVVVAIVAEALLKIGKRALKHPLHLAIAAAAFGALAIGGVPFPVVVLTAGLFGWLGTKLAPTAFPASAVSESTAPRANMPPLARTAKVLAIGLALWAGPFIVITLWRGTNSLPAQEFRFFSQAALVTFGGAYAVLAYIIQAVTAPGGWLTRAQAIDGLALAETTPGPLIMVLQFVGFVAAWNRPEGMSMAAAALLGAAITTYTTFLPSFLFIFAGAPYIEGLRGHKGLTGALAAITAAVVGVILNLALVFGSAVLWHGGIEWVALALALAAFAALYRFHVNVMWVVLVGGALGWLLRQGL